MDWALIILPSNRSSLIQVSLSLPKLRVRDTSIPRDTVSHATKKNVLKRQTRALKALASYFAGSKCKAQQRCSTGNSKIYNNRKCGGVEGRKHTKSQFKVAMPTNENESPTMFQIRGRTFRGVKPPSPPPVLGIIVNEHVIGDCQDMAVHVDGGRHHDLETGEENE